MSSQIQEGAEEPTECYCYFSFSANATYASLCLPPHLEPPHAITTYCFPFTAYTAGVATPEAGRSVSNKIFPVLLLMALNFLSAVAAMKIKPPAVTTGAP